MSAHLGLILAAAEHVERSKVPFFFAGGLLAGFAILVSVIGFTKADFPASAETSRGLMGLGAVLVALTMFCAVYVSN